MSNKILILMAVLLGSTGCAHHRTIHDVCVDPKVSSHYSDYDECFAEIKEHRAHRRQAQHERAMILGDGLGTGLNQFANGIKQPVPTQSTCTSTNLYGTITTQCN